MINGAGPGYREVELSLDSRNVIKMVTNEGWVEIVRICDVGLDLEQA
jgi:hypothetical protein